MSQMAHRDERGARDQVVFAAILIVVGVAGLASRLWHPSGDLGGWIVALIGLGFLGAFAYTRQYGYLIPGSIMAGLGIGIVVSKTFAFASGESTGGAVVLGLGLGFAGIWAIGTAVHVAEHHWWPLIPGGILATVGTALLIGGGAIEALDYWGVVLVVIGALVIVRSLTTRRPQS